jgi:hypothetical protein
MPSDEEYQGPESGPRYGPIDERSAAFAPGPRGLGGWLVLPIIGLVATCFLAIAWMLANAIPIFQSGAWGNLTNSDSSLYLSWFAPTILFEIFVNAVLIVLPIFLLVLLFRKRSIVPRLLSGFYAFVLFTTALDAIVMITVGVSSIRDAGYFEAAQTMADETITALVRAVLAAAIWIPYFLVSKRVKNTFLEGKILSAQPSSGNRRVPVWILIASIAVVLGCAGVLIWRTAALSVETAEQTPAPGTYLTYTDPEYGFTFRYPGDWILRETDISGQLPTEKGTRAVHVFDPDGSGDDATYFDWAEVSVFELETALTRPQIAATKAYLEDMLASPDADPGSKILEAISEITVGELTGYRATLTGDLDGTPVTYAYVWLFGGSMEYDLTLQAGTETWAKNRATFDGLLESLKPGAALY